MSNVTLTIEIFYEDDYIYPKFSGEVRVESGAFYYEYGSIRGTHDPGDDFYVENVDWNRDEFTSAENEFIENYYEENNEKIEDELYKYFIKSIKDNF